jgi:hypothetical protein
MNKYLPHILVLPEDDANRQLADGFLNEKFVAVARAKVLGVAGGWIEVLSRFKVDHVGPMDRWDKRLMILLIDFDDRGAERLREAKEAIPAHLTERVFVLGTKTDPESLKKDLGSYETIGQGLAENCYYDTYATWGHEQLRHNAEELERLRRAVRPILFPPTTTL